MATNYKVLAQINPSATTASDAYTVPASTEAIISTIVVANVGTVDGTYRLSIRPNGAGQEDKHYIAYNTSIPANDSIALTLGVTMDAADVLTVFASNASLAFNVFGAELS
jgi:hypothetical protein